MQHVSFFIPAMQAIYLLIRFFQLRVVHRDVKPENILMDVAGHIALSDYGLCKRLGHSAKVNVISS
jgi:serine/threonine protein kinase